MIVSVDFTIDGRDTALVELEMEESLQEALFRCFSEARDCGKWPAEDFVATVRYPNADGTKDAM